MKRNYFKENWISLVTPIWWTLLWMSTKTFILMIFLMVSYLLTNKTVTGSTVSPRALKIIKPTTLSYYHILIFNVD